MNTGKKALFPGHILLLMAALPILCMKVQAGNIITGGTHLKILTGTTVVSSEALVVNSGATLDNAGTLILKKDLTNSNASPNYLGTGTLELSGTTGQMVSGENILENLTVSNAAGVQINGQTTVTGNLTLTNGRIALGGSNLLLGADAVIMGTPSASAMIVATGTGELRKEFATGFTGSFTFPVGDNTETAEYSPVTLVFIAGTFVAGNYAGVNLVNAVYPDPAITGNYLNRYWNLTQSGITDMNCTASFQYVPADVTGTENLLACTRVSPAPWTTYGVTNATTHMLTATGLTAFSTFTGLKSTTTPQNQILANIAIPAGTTTCYDAVQILTIAGDGNTFLVEDGGSVTLIAGVKISLLPGVTVNSGGYLLAKISTEFCNTLLNPLVLNPESLGNELLSIREEDPASLIRIYPNPTEDAFILEFTGEQASAGAVVNIYTLRGQTILTQTLGSGLPYRVSLAGQPVGIYVVQVRTEERVEVAKVVKK